METIPIEMTPEGSLMPDSERTLRNRLIAIYENCGGGSFLTSYSLSTGTPLEFREGERDMPNKVETLDTLYEAVHRALLDDRVAALSVMLWDQTSDDIQPWDTQEVRFEREATK